MIPERKSTPADVFLTVLFTVIVVGGCAADRWATSSPALVNSVQVPQNQFDAVWERSVAVLNDLHFTIARESKLEGVIETDYRAGSGLLEPWHQDSVGLAARMESTLQSIRRRVLVNFTNSAEGAVIVNVRALRELEDVPGPTATYAGGATFNEADPLTRDLDQVLGQSGASRWLPRGTDPR
ncbi:MAG: hypothetical protein KDA89_05090, partial [Planctomycetaceae bacterium]|nr:hypothetical protein [Planctomycetaceae bacterium]